MPGLPPVALDPELALVLFLPPLLLDGAYYTAFGRFRRHLPGILSLAIGAVVFTTLVVGPFPLQHEAVRYAICAMDRICPAGEVWAIAKLEAPNW